MKKLLSPVLVAIAGFLALFSSLSANAAVDVTDALTDITATQTAVLSVLGAMLAMVIAIWGIRFVIRIFGRMR